MASVQHPVYLGANPMKYELGDIITFGEYKWRILDIQNERALLLSEKIIKNRSFHSTLSHNKWAKCQLREYLNGINIYRGKGFYDTFSIKDKARIVKTEVFTGKNPWFGTKGSGYTTDWVFTLSIEEVIRYFGDSGQLINKNSDDRWIDDIYNVNRATTDIVGEAIIWWLRSPGYNPGDITYVGETGKINVYGASVVNNSGGVRPALWVYLENDTSTDVVKDDKVKPNIGDLYHFGKYDWRVLDIQDGIALLLSEQSIEKRAFHHSFVPISWAKCDLHDFLNGINKYQDNGFYDTFTSQEKACIAEINIKTKNNPWYDVKGGNNTIDKIFLLSIDEVLRYFGDSGRLKNRVSDFGYISDDFNVKRKTTDATGTYLKWWLRSSGNSPAKATYVSEDGALNIDGEPVVYESGGVRPALWMSIM